MHISTPKKALKIDDSWTSRGSFFSFKNPKTPLFPNLPENGSDNAAPRKPFCHLKLVIDMLQKVCPWFYPYPSWCYICKKDIESQNHTFFHSQVSAKIWTEQFSTGWITVPYLETLIGSGCFLLIRDSRLLKLILHLA